MTESHIDKILRESKEQTGKEEPLDSVDLIASGYEWICPDCKGYNREIGVTLYVSCKKCNRTFEVDDHLHAYN